MKKKVEMGVQKTAAEEMKEYYDAFEKSELDYFTPESEKEEICKEQPKSLVPEYSYNEFGFKNEDLSADLYSTHETDEEIRNSMILNLLFPSSSTDILYQKRHIRTNPKNLYTYHETTQDVSEKKIIGMIAANNFGQFASVKDNDFKNRIDLVNRFAQLNSSYFKNPVARMYFEMFEKQVEAMDSPFYPKENSFAQPLTKWDMLRTMWEMAEEKYGIKKYKAIEELKSWYVDIGGEYFETRLKDLADEYMKKYAKISRKNAYVNDMFYNEYVAKRVQLKRTSKNDLQQIREEKETKVWENQDGLEDLRDHSEVYEWEKYQNSNLEFELSQHITGQPYYYNFIQSLAAHKERYKNFVPVSAENIEKTEKELKKVYSQKPNKKMLYGIDGKRFVKLHRISADKDNFTITLHVINGGVPFPEVIEGRPEREIFLTFKAKKNDLIIKELQDTLDILVDYPSSYDNDLEKLPIFIANVSVYAPDDSQNQFIFGFEKVIEREPVESEELYTARYLNNLENLWLFDNNLGQKKFLIDLWQYERRISARKCLIDIKLTQNEFDISRTNWDRLLEDKCFEGFNATIIKRYLDQHRDADGYYDMLDLV
jgi:hypothetical protein